MEKGKNKIFIIVISIILLILILAIVLPKFPIAILNKTFNYAAQNFENVSGLSPWLIKGILVFALFPFYWALLELFKIKIPFINNKKSFKKTAKIVILAYTGLFFLTMFFLSRGTYFGHFKGEAIKYYALTPEGIRFFDSPGFDSKYGIELKPVTSDMMVKFQKKTLGMQPKRIDIEEIKNMEFFDPITGEAIIWYYLDNNGNYEFFNGPGFHSLYNVELKPVNFKVIKSYQNKIKERQEKATIDQNFKIEIEKQQKQISFLNKYINLSIVNSPLTKEIAILVIDESDKENNEIESKIASIIRSAIMNPVLSLFKRPFIQERLFAGIFSGDISTIKEFQLENRIDFLIFGKINKDFKRNEELQDVISAHLGIDIKIYSCVKGVLVNSASLKTTGAGFSNAEAEGKALELMNDNLNNLIKESF